jgi:hypothetical protein
MYKTGWEIRKSYAIYVLFWYLVKGSQLSSFSQSKILTYTIVPNSCTPPNSSTFQIYVQLRAKSVQMNSLVSLMRLMKFNFKVLSQTDSERNPMLICMTYCFLISRFISLIERHVFNVKACLLFMNNFIKKTT